MSFANSTDNALPIPILQATDAELLLIAGQYASFNSKLLIGELLMYGAYFVLVLLAVHTIVARPQRSYWLLTALVITFSVATILCGTDIAGLIALYQTIFVDGPSPVQQRFQLYNDWYDYYRFQAVGYWIGSAGDMGFLYIINDILASWRALAIWQTGGRRILAMLQCFFIFSSFALWMTCASLVSRMSTAVSNFNGLPEHDHGVVVHNLIIASSTASVAANLLATSMIGCTAYQCRQRIKFNQGHATQGVKILALVTESGVLYAAIQIVRLALIATPSTSLDFAISTCVFQSATQIVTAMYTPALIILIHYGYSITNTTTQLDSSKPDSFTENGRPRRVLSSMHFQHSRTTGVDNGYSKHALVGASFTTSGDGGGAFGSEESSELSTCVDMHQEKSRPGMAI